MSEDKETSTESSESSEARSSKNQDFASGLFQLLFKLILLLFISIIGYLAFLYWDSFLSNMLKKVENVETNIANHQQALGELNYIFEKEYDKREQDWADYIENQNAWSDVQEQRITQMNERLVEVLSDNEHKWVYAEVNYWIRLANQRLALDQNYHKVSKLLVSAREQLLVIDTSHSRAILKAVNKDLDKLEAVSSINTRELYYQMSSLKVKLATANFIETDNQLLVNEQKTEQIINSEELGLFEKFIASLKAYMSSLVAIKYSDKVDRVDPFDDEKKFYIRNDIALTVEQIKLAILDNRWSIAKQLLDSLNKTVTTYLDEEEVAYTIAELQKVFDNSLTVPIKLQSPYSFKQQMQILKIKLDN